MHAPVTFLGRQPYLMAESAVNGAFFDGPESFCKRDSLMSPVKD